MSNPPPSSPPPASGDNATQGNLRLILGLLVTAQFIVVVDYSIVQIALPTIRDQLAMSLADSQWILSAYGLTFAGFLLLSGRLSDIYGRKRLFLLGLLVFSFSSLAAGLAGSEDVIIVARVVQGVGAALSSATGLALITRIFAPLGRLNQALGVFTAVSASGFSAGVLLGGVLTEALGWRWIFFVNVPIGIVAAILSYRSLPDLSAERMTSRHLDIPGAVTVTAGLMLLVYGLSEVGNGDTSVTTYASFILAGLVLAAFIAIENRSPFPIMPLGFLRRRTVFFANATALLTFATTSPWVFFLTSYFQVLRGYAPLEAAAALVPGAMVFFFVGGFGAPRLVRSVGAKPVLVGAMVLLTVGVLLTSRLSLSSGYFSVVLPSMLVASFGGALSATAANIAALAGAARGEEGVASGLINTSRQVGGPVGLAFAVSVVGVVTHGLGTFAPAPELLSAFQDAFAVSAAFSAVAIAASLLVGGRQNPSSAAGPEKPPAAMPAE